MRNKKWINEKKSRPQGFCNSAAGALWSALRDVTKGRIAQLCFGTECLKGGPSKKEKWRRNADTYILPFVINLLHLVTMPLQLFVALLAQNLDVHLDVVSWFASVKNQRKKRFSLKKKERAWTVLKQDGGVWNAGIEHTQRLKKRLKGGWGGGSTINLHASWEKKKWLKHQNSSRLPEMLKTFNLKVSVSLETTAR